MKKNKGFTLVELLAIIVILGLLSIVIVPKVVNTIKSSRKSSHEVSVNNLVKALSSISIDKKATLTPFSGCSIDFSSGVNTCSDLSYAGQLPDNGSISVDSDGVVNGTVGYGEERFFVSNNNVEIELLPKEYVRVKYIESTGTQYIDTGVTANQDTGFDIEFKTKDAINTTTYGSIFGARKSSAVNELQLTTYSNSATYKGTLRYGTGGQYNADIADLSSVQHVSLRNKVYFGNSGTTLNLSNTFTTPVSVTVFALNQNGTVIQHGKLQLYSFKLYDGNTLIRNFVPCYRERDNVIGLYDLVNNKFYTNSGTGNFVIGD